MVNCDILIITPPRRAVFINTIVHNYPPLSQGIDSVPLRLAAVLQKMYHVAFLPFYLLFYNYYEINTQSVINYLRIYNPKIIIFSTDYLISNRSTACFTSSLRIAEICKEMFPSVKIVYTGKHALVNPECFFTTKQPLIDLVINQEPEDFICDVITKLLTDSLSQLLELPNIYLHQKGEVLKSKFSVKPPIVDSLPPPAYNLLIPYMDAILEHEKPYDQKLSLTIRTSYGCPYECPYCAGVSHWRNYRKRSGKNVSRDLNAAFKHLGDDAEFTFLDDELFTFDPEHVKEIAGVFANYKIKLQGVLTHVKHFDSSTAEIISKFCHSVIFGAENFNKQIISSMKNHQSFDDIIKACQLAKLNGITTRLEFIAGLPNEDWESIVYNLNKIYNLMSTGFVDELIPYILTPHPGTMIATSPELFGMTIVSSDYEKYIEEGAFPVYYTKNLNREQIYIYYLLIKQISSMSKNMKSYAKINDFKLSEANYNCELFKKYII
jgi:radical SAM superfamily enzyme YgiQ (UPF0313 family)